MRFSTLAGGLAAVMTLSLLTPTSASAFGWKHYDRDSAVDPYAYTYEHRGYYPYYGSDYWRPAHMVKRRRFRFEQPRYYWAWGYYKKDWPKYHRGHTHRKHHW